MIDKFKNEHIDLLFKAMKSLDTIEDYYKFFDDICTIVEINEMSKRLQAAIMLDSEVVYTEITRETGLSTATISRVNKSLRYGSDGYALAIKNLRESGEIAEK